MVEFGLLGEVTAYVGGQPIDVGPARQRLVLAALLVDVNRVVTFGQLAERVWGEAPPQRARGVLTSYVSRLRQALGGANLAWRSGGYVLTVDRSAVDMHRFRDLCDRARATTDPTLAATLLTDALRLWRGPALTGVDSQWADAERDRLDQQRLQAERDLTDARLEAGGGEDLVTELRSRATEQPFDERVAGQYMLALYRAGRTADAFEHYQQVRSRLADELGTDPAPPLQDLHQRILHADLALMGATRQHTGRPAAAPQQLPAPPTPFVGRDRALTEVTALLAKTGRRTIVITGAGGIGKTWLALAWAHRHLDRFPDGQLYVSLRGFDPSGKPMSTEAAVRVFLHALRVDPSAIPGDLDAQVNLYRSLVAGKRMLVVLDNAADTNQIIPLLPGGSSCTVLVTSRNTLTGLAAAHGAHKLTLSVLSVDEAHDLLSQRLGPDRMTAEPEAVESLVHHCAGLPLALGIVAARATDQLDLPLAVLADELRDQTIALDALDTGDADLNLRAVFSWSYRALTAETTRVFCLLALAPGADIALPAAAALTALPTDRIGVILRRLTAAHLIQQHHPGRYRLHDLVRLYAAEQAAHSQSEARRAEALRRLIDFYLHTAFAGERLLQPHREPVTLPDAAAGCHPLGFADETTALSWFAAEHANLLAAQRSAAAQRWHLATWQLAWALNTFHWRHAYAREDLEMWRLGLTAAGHLDDAKALVVAHRSIGYACVRTGLHAEALTHHQHAITLAEGIGDRPSQAYTHLALAFALTQTGDSHRALEHATSALTLFQSLSFPVWKARALQLVGRCHIMLGHHTQAAGHCEAALALFRRHRHREGEALALNALAQNASQAGQHAEALAYRELAIAAFRDLGNVNHEADALNGLAHACHALGQRDRAHETWRRALDLYRMQYRTRDVESVLARLAATS